MNSQDRRRSLLKALGRELRWEPLTRRRLLRELAQHLDDAVADLQASGLPADAALEEALRRLGDAQTIAEAVRSARLRPPRHPRSARLRSPAWIAVGVMSLVTAWAAELPQASGAKATAGHRGPVHSGVARAARRNVSSQPRARRTSRVDRVRLRP